MPAFHSEAAQSAFERAVERERQAIVRHEQSAQRQDELADSLEQRAGHARDALVAQVQIDQAAAARERAKAARERAATARKRLRDEGVEPDV